MFILFTSLTFQTVKFTIRNLNTRNISVTTLQGKSQYGVRKLNSGIYGSPFVYNKKSFKVPFMKYFISLVALLEFD